jgi:hypothetical protein
MRLFCLLMGYPKDSAVITIFALPILVPKLHLGTPPVPREIPFRAFFHFPNLRFSRPALRA